MPNFDKKGPNGAGPKTGRGGGSCDGQAVMALTGRGVGIGMGRCGGMRRGFGRGLCIREVSLNEQERILERELKAVRDAKKNVNKEK